MAAPSVLQNPDDPTQPRSRIRPPTMAPLPPGGAAATQAPAPPAPPTGTTWPGMAPAQNVGMSEPAPPSAPTYGLPTQPTQTQAPAEQGITLDKPAMVVDDTGQPPANTGGGPVDINPDGTPWNPGQSDLYPGGTVGGTDVQGYASGGTAAYDPNNPRTWIDSMLQSVQSTDDPSYWYSKIANDPNVQNAATRDSALAYWADRIRRGDGSALVKNGQLSLYQDGSAQGGGGVGGPPPPSAFQQQMRQMLMDMIAKGQQPVDLSSPDIQQPFEAAALDGQRNMEAERKGLAERLYAEGGGSGSNELQQGIQQSAERNAASLGDIHAQLIGRAFQAKQAQLQQALTLAMQSGDAEAARNIQLYITQLQLAQQKAIWDDQYGLRIAEDTDQRNRDAAGAKAGL